MKKNYLLPFLLVVLGTILYFMANIQRVAVPGSIFDILQETLQANPASITALGASFMYIYAISQLIIGILISRYGGFRVITTGSVIFVIGSLLFPFSKSLWLLYLSRGLVGLGSAAFYLGIIQETKKIVHKNNFGVVLSIILFIGYLGGILAGAPLVFCVDKIGWRQIFFGIGIVTFILTLAFVIIKTFVPKQETDRSVHFNLELYKNVLTNKGNLNLYTFACINYSLYYVLQTVIGKKFLEDFCQIPTMTAAIVLSVMGALYAIAGPVMATISKAVLNRRTIFLRISAIDCSFMALFTIICLCFNFRTPVIGILFCLIAFFACLSPLTVPLLHDLNGQRESSTAISSMTSGFYFMVAILGNLVGFILNSFSHSVSAKGTFIYSNQAYLIIFLIMFALSVISLRCAFKIQESKKTLRFLQMRKYIEDKEEHWHDKYEHDIYSNI